MEKKRHSILKEYLYFNQREAPLSFKETLKNLAESSSLHGIPKIVSSRQIAVKVLWCLLFLGTFTVLTTQLFDLFRTYYLYPVKTTVSLQYGALAFPAVTICNMNPIRKSQLGMSESLKLTFEKEPLHDRSRRDVQGNKQLPEAPFFPNRDDLEKSTESYKHLPTPHLERQFDFLDKVLREEIKDETGGKHAALSSVFSQPNYIPGVRRRIRASGAETSAGTAGSSAKSPETPFVKSGTSSDKDDSSTTKTNTSSSASGASSDISDSSGTKTDTSKTTSGTSSDISGSSGTKTDTSKTTSGTSSDMSGSSGTKTDTSKTTNGTSSDISGSSGTKTDTSKTTSGTSSDMSGASGTKTDTSKTTSGTSSDMSGSSGTKTDTSKTTSGTSSDMSGSPGTKTDTSKTTSVTSSDISCSSGTKTDTSKTTSGTSSDMSGSSGTKTDTSKTTSGTSSDISGSSGTKTDTSKTTSGTSSDMSSSSGTKTDTSKTTSGTSSDISGSSGTKTDTSKTTSGTSSDMSGSSGTKTDTLKTTSGTSSDISGSSGTKTDTSKTTSGTSSDMSGSSGTKTDTSKTTSGTLFDKSNSSCTKTDTSKTTSATSSDKTDSSGTKTDSSKTTSATSSDETDSSGTKTGEEDSSDPALTSKVDWGKWASWYNDYYKSTKDNKSSSASDTYQSSTGGTMEKEWNSHDPKKYVFAQMFSKKDRWDCSTLFKNENIKDRRQMGHQKEDMILSASFSGVLENETSFQDFSSSEYGNCYTMSSTEYVSWGSGPSHGIKLTLNLEIDEYMPIFSTGYGIRILLHEPGTYPLPSNEGITLSPGTETNIGLRLVRISRLGRPHGDCVNGKDFAWRYRMKYSKAVCYQFCRIRKAMDVCKCIPVDSPDEVNLGQLTDLSVCNVTKTSEKLCLLGVDVRFNNGEYDCDCSGPCKETVYSKTMSSRLWPTDDYLDVLMDEMCTSNYTLTSSVCANKDNLTFDQIEKYRKNFLRVLIYYEDLNYESITQEPMYEFARFVSDIGGAMGLFLGASVLSLVEFLQLILEIFLFATKKGTQDKNRVEILKRDHFVVEG